jgi:hypothetical protein
MGVAPTLVGICKGGTISMQMRKEVEFFQSFEMIIIVCLSKKHTYLKKNCDIE